MFQIERKMAEGSWYEVILSPFKTLKEVESYLQKYSKYYPKEDRVYRVTNNPK